MNAFKMKAAAIALMDNNCEANYVEHINQSCPFNVLALIEQRRALLAACQEFVRKVDAGEAESVRSYREMKSAIELCALGERLPD